MRNPFKKFSEKDKTLRATVRGIIRSVPSNLDLYKLAVRHSSVSKESNERLEYLGDAILGAIVAEYLFKKYPYKDEGFLTEIRSRIVKRETLNTLAIKLGLSKIVEFQASHKKSKTSHKSIYGNALEAFIGAVYLDKGYKFCARFVIQNIVSPHIDINSVIKNNSNFKSLLIEWAQKHNKEVRFDIVDEEGDNHSKIFTAQVFVDEAPYGIGKGASKKKAEQAAAEKTCSTLEVLESE